MNTNQNGNKRDRSTKKAQTAIAHLKARMLRAIKKAKKDFTGKTATDTTCITYDLDDEYDVASLNAYLANNGECTPC